jgi:serine/threonine-protein kinase mTOR
MLNIDRLEEVIEYKTTNSESKKNLILEKWKNRLKGAEWTNENWSKLFNIHNLVISPLDDRQNYLKFAKRCRKTNNIKLGRKIMNKLLNCIDKNIPEDPYELIKLISPKYPSVSFEYLLQEINYNNLDYWIDVLKYFTSQIDDKLILSRGYLTLGMLSVKNSDKFQYFQKATSFDENWYKAWHNCALINTHLLETSTDKSNYLKNAIHAYFKSISLSNKQNNALQDTLRLLSVFFKYENEEYVDIYFNEDLHLVNVDSWLQVIPQLIARVNTKKKSIQNVIHNLLLEIGKVHPLALTYPLTVTSKSSEESRKEASTLLINQMKLLHPKIIDQASLVSEELIRVAILWSELFHEHLENSFKLFQKKNYVESLKLLKKITLLSENAVTFDEISFQQKYGNRIQDAWEWCSKYEKTNDIIYFIQAWEIYYSLSTQIQQDISLLKSLDLKFVSPKLLRCSSLEINIPGTYQPEVEAIRILKFDQTLEVMESKQKPRKLKMLGSNGKWFQFLLKGHEDLRQDERVMQLLDLVNKLLFNVPDLKKKDLKITRYSVLVLSSNAGKLFFET